jgi:TRAP-type C4-dicarboxylate transport system substrate-binding protein
VLKEAAIEAEKRVVASFSELEKQERPLLIKEGIQVIELPPAEKEKFLKVSYDSAWEDILKKCADTGPKLRELLTKKK